MFSEYELRAAGQTARDQYRNPVGKCYEICHTFGNLLIDNGLPARQDAYTVREFRVGTNGEENHFICILPGEYTVFADNESDVWIDLSLDQFNEANVDAGNVSIVVPDAEPVAIMTTGDDRRDRYMTVEEYLDVGLESQ